MEKVAVPGLSVAFVRDGRVDQVSEYGVSNIETGAAVRGDQVFQAASLSKPVFAYMVMRMVDQGILTLDQPLIELLDYDRFEDKENAAKVTARLVLSHQPGLRNWGSSPLEFVWSPGTRFSYSGEGYVYLQRVLEKATGLTLDELAAREVFEPLGMVNSHFRVKDKKGISIVTAHNVSGQPQPTSFPDENAASSLHTNAHDYARFVKAVMVGDGLSPASHQAMLSGQVTTPFTAWAGGAEPKLSESIDWALGWGIIKSETGPKYWHWGDNGDFKAFVAMDPASVNAAVYFANAVDGLFIYRDMMGFVDIDTNPVVDWLQGPQYDTPGYAEARKAVEAITARDYLTAATLFRTAASKSSAIKWMVGTRADWYEKHAKNLANPAMLSDEQLDVYTGQYGPRRLFGEDGKLFYQRGEGAISRLYPIGKHRFIFADFTGFELELRIGDKGVADRAIGHYGGGNTDGFDRTD